MGGTQESHLASEYRAHAKRANDLLARFAAAEEELAAAHDRDESTSDLVVSTCQTWAEACDAVEDAASHALQLRSGDRALFRESADYLTELYEALLEAHAELKLNDCADVERILEIETSFLSVTQQVVALAAPDKIQRIRSAAEAGGYPLEGLVLADIARDGLDSTEQPWLDRAFLAAGLAHRLGHVDVAESWGLSPDDAHVRTLQQLIGESGRMAMLAARHALKRSSLDEESLLAQHVMRLRSASDESYDPKGAGDRERGRRAKHNNMRFALAQVLQERAYAGGAEATPAALAILALSVTARGQLRDGLCGTGGMVPALRSLKGVIADSAWMIAYDVGPNEARGTEGVVAAERLLAKIRSSIQDVGAEGVTEQAAPVPQENRQPDPVGHENPMPADVPQENRQPAPFGQENLLNTPWPWVLGGAGMLALILWQVISIVYQPIQFVPALVGACVFPLIALLLQGWGAWRGSSLEIPEWIARRLSWINDIKDAQALLALLLLVEACVVPFFLFCALNFTRVDLEWTRTEHWVRDSTTSWSFINPPLGRLLLSKWGGVSLSGHLSKNEAEYLDAPKDRESTQWDNARRLVFRRFYLALFVFGGGLRTMALWIILLQRFRFMRHVSMGLLLVGLGALGRLVAA